MIGIGFFWFCFGFATLWVRSMSTSVSSMSTSKCSSIAFKRILPALCPCSSGIPWTRRQFLLVYYSRLSTSDFNCSCSFLTLKILLLLKELRNCISSILVCGHYFVQYNFLQVSIFYRFFWTTSFLSFCTFSLVSNSR